MVTKRDGLIEMGPHVTGPCVIVLDEKVATELLRRHRAVVGVSGP